MIEQRAIVAARRRTHVAERVLGFEEKLEVVGAGVADVSGLANHAQDVRLVQQRGMHSGAHLVGKLVLQQERKRLAEPVVEHGAVRQFPRAVGGHFVVQSDVIDEVILKERTENLRIAAVSVDFDEVAEILDLRAKLVDVGQQSGLAAGEHHRVQEVAAFLEESDLVHHAAIVREGEVGVVAVGTAQVTTVVPKDASGLFGII